MRASSRGAAGSRIRSPARFRWFTTSKSARASAPSDALLALGQDLPEQRVERLEHRAERPIPVVLVVLAADVIPLLAREGLQDLLHQRRLADARVARDEDDLARAAKDAEEGVREALDALLAAVEPLVDLEHVRGVALAELEAIEAALREAPPALEEIGEQAARGLITILRVLGEQLDDQIAEQGRHGGVARRRVLRDEGDVGVDELERVARLEGQVAGEHPVEEHAERVQVRAVVDAAVHAAGLLGREVREHVGQDSLAVERLALLGDRGVDSVVQDPHLPVAGEEEAPRPDGAVHDLVPVQHTHRLGHGDGEIEALADVKPAVRDEKPPELLSGGVLEHEDEVAIVLLHAVDLDDPIGLDARDVPVLVLEARAIHDVRGAGAQHLEHHGGAVARADGAVARRVAARVEVDDGVVAG
ncbi:uncharacterized protein SOCE26_020620 [Sorangium cellulosum]|uniref:Uncharacterized protein n=1 Tax=Sorangium cellulosum TaxID=56 RepID=A0A2L0EMX8_SORCE|nr:uncharacterized protein SOCE26_020620 [Sorangium cellulosum]